MATAPEFTKAQQKRAPAEESEQEKFLAILQNRHKAEPRGNWPVRRNGFVVLVRGGKNLKSIQSLCFFPEQSWNTCLTARYRLQPDAVLGTLLARLSLISGKFSEASLMACWARFNPSRRIQCGKIF
ncbi:MAG: hypothetical protein ACRENG_15450 [bacterium]